MRKYLVTTLGLASILFYSEIGYCDFEESATVTVNSCSVCDNVCTRRGGTVVSCSVIKGGVVPGATSVTVTVEGADSCNYRPPQL